MRKMSRLGVIVRLSGTASLVTRIGPRREENRISEKGSNSHGVDAAEENQW